MKPKSFSAFVGWQSFMFCIGMYVVALFFSIFVCSSIFYAFNSRSASGKESVAEKTVSASSPQVLAAVNH